MNIEIGPRDAAYLVRLLNRERAAWQTAHDNSASHDAIVRRDKAAATLAIIDSLIGALTDA